MTRVRGILGALVLVGAALVLAGVGQGSAPRGAAPSAADAAAERMRVATGNRAVRQGAAQFHAQGCDDCHALAAGHAAGRLGPRLDVVLRDLPRTAIEQFITDPRTSMIPGYDNNLMPRDYARRLAPRVIRQLASFLATAAAPSGASAQAPAAAPTTVATGLVQIAYRNILIAPERLTVRVGAKLRWTNYALHSLRSVPLVYSVAGAGENG